MDGLETGSLVAAPQPADGVSLAPKITVEDAEVDWSQPAVRVDRQVRACTPAPGAWTTFAGERLKLGPVTLLADDAVARARRARRSTRTGCGSARRRTPSCSARCAPQGKKAMAAADWARGARPSAGSTLGR